jgi:glycerophosphoryl diester phosphodiesterase
VQIIGHRGSRATHPENTMAAFAHALSCGADGIELDVVVTRDDKLAVTHDLTLGDGRAVYAHLAAELSLPTLEQVLRLNAPRGFWFDIEAKSEPGRAPEPRAYARLLSASIREGALSRSIQVRSFDHSILRALREVEAEIPLAALIDFDSGEWVTIARSAEASIISPHYSTITQERVALAHEAGIRVSAWTVNDADDWVRLATIGVDTIITDDPAAMVEWRRNYFKYLFKSG